MLIVFLIVLVISMQVTQQVYVAEDWVRSTNNNLNIEIQNPPIQVSREQTHEFTAFIESHQRIQNHGM